MTINEKQIKERIMYGIEKQEIIPNRTLKPELKKAEILEMGYKTNQDTTRKKYNMSVIYDKE